MFILDNPFVSPFLIQTIKENKYPVIDCTNKQGVDSLTSKQAIKHISSQTNPTIYSNSENAIDWINQNLSFSDLPDKINTFKDKYKFRQLIQPMYPEFYFQSININELESVKSNNIPMPFIIKPRVGFFSMGVYKVNSHDEWTNTIDLIRQEMQHLKGLYPTSVMDDEDFIIEQCINGEEFAFDAYINDQGQAVVLSILKHTFASSEDVNDRVYTTSKEIIETNLKEFTEFTQQVADLSQVKNFPLHIELRRDSKGNLTPIEVNPMRFGGWCTTADMSYYAYGFNQYSYYINQQKPNWASLLQEKENKLFSVIVLDNSSGISTDKIKKFNFKKVVDSFTHVLESRIVDYKKFPLFGFLFVETSADDNQQLTNILLSDLSEYIEL
jgi:carbamoylphosphate synthase large subunit